MIPNYSMIPAAAIQDPQVFDDPQLFDDQLEVWTLIIEKSTVIPPSLMVLLFQDQSKSPILLFDFGTALQNHPK